MKKSKKLPLIFISILALIAILVVGISFVEKSSNNVFDLINEIHDIDTETTVLYNDFQDDFYKFSDFADSGHSSKDELNTIKTYSDNAIESSKKTKDEINLLIGKIETIKSKNLNDLERNYIEKLEQATRSYNDNIDASLKLIDSKTRITEYNIYSSMFSENYNEIYNSIAKKLTVYESQGNWDALDKELISLNLELDEAIQNINGLKDSLGLDSFKTYDQWASSMKEFFALVKPLYEKEKKGATLSQSEINAITEAIVKTDVFKADSDGYIWGPNEKDEFEAYKRNNVYEYEDDVSESFNRAEAYYNDAVLNYEQLLKNQK